MKKLALILLTASISSVYGAISLDSVLSCTTSSSSSGNCEGCCINYTPPALVVPKHKLDFARDPYCICICATIEHSDWTAPALFNPLCEQCNGNGSTTVCDACMVGATPRSSSSSSASTAPMTYFPSAQIIHGIIYTPDAKILGSLELKVGKLNKSSQVVKVSGKITDVNGKKYSSPVANVFVGTANVLTCDLTFPAPFGTFPVTVADAATEQLVNSVSSTGCLMQSCELGGSFNNDIVTFTFAGEDLMDLPTGYDFVLDEMSWNTSGTVSRGTKLKFPPTRAPKLVPTYPGYIITGLEYKNVRSLKLSYNKKTGLIKGSYNLFYSNIDSTTGTPLLKKSPMQVRGFYFDNAGYGVVANPNGACAGTFQLH